MLKAPATVFVFNPEDAAPWAGSGRLDPVMTLVDTQSIGAAIQNMLLRAREFGVGSLWIADTFSAHDAICRWLGRNGLLVAAVALGYPAETPGPRPRRRFEELTEWRGQGTPATSDGS